MSRSLQYRIDAAYEYANGPSQHDPDPFRRKGEGEDVSEASIMYDYLKDKGVPEHQMLKEEQSESTYENLVYSKLLIDAREAERRRALERLLGESGYTLPLESESSVRIGVLTSNFHVPKSQSNRQKHRLYQRGKRQRPLRPSPVFAPVRTRMLRRIKRPICGKYVMQEFQAQGLGASSLADKSLHLELEKT